MCVKLATGADEVQQRQVLKDAGGAYEQIIIEEEASKILFTTMN